MDEQLSPSPPSLSPPTDAAAPAAPPGYRSTADRKRMITLACVLAGVALLLMIVVPKVVALVGGGLLMGIELEATQLNHAAVWDGRVWYVRNAGSIGRGVRTELVSIGLDGEEDPARPPVPLNGVPTVFYHNSAGGDPHVAGLRQNDGAWQEYLQYPISLDIGMGICPAGGGDDFILLRRILPLRNLLRLLDGLLWYLPGMVIVALTAKWQRLGDLAAKTIVIRKPRAAPDAGQ